MIEIYDKEDIQRLIRDAVREEIRNLAVTLKCEIESGTIKVPSATIRIDVPDETPIENLEWSVRLGRIFPDAGIKTFGQLCSMSRRQLLKHRNLGEKSMREINHTLQKYGRPTK